MARLIDVYEYIKNSEAMNAQYRFGSVEHRMLTAFAEELLTAPTIDAEPARHGHWIDRHVTDFGVAEEFCGRCEEWSIGWHKKYCPNCGAKMDEVET